MKTPLFDAHIKRIFCTNKSRLITFSTLVLLLFCSVLSADVPMSDAELLPGKEIRITAPKTAKTFLLYVPVDYTDKRPFPVLFYYHGYRGTATTEDVQAYHKRRRVYCGRYELRNRPLLQQTPADRNGKRENLFR